MYSLTEVEDDFRSLIAYEETDHSFKRVIRNKYKLCVDTFNAI